MQDLLSPSWSQAVAKRHADVLLLAKRSGAIAGSYHEVRHVAILMKMEECAGGNDKVASRDMVDGTRPHQPLDGAPWLRGGVWFCSGTTSFMGSPPVHGKGTEGYLWTPVSMSFTGTEQSIILYLQENEPLCTLWTQYLRVL